MVYRIKLTVLAASVLVACVSFLFLGRTVQVADSDRSSSSAASRSLYVNNCARCHGGDGRGDTELGRLNESPDISGGKLKRRSTARLKNMISRGRGSMPGFGKKLTASQIASLAAYVRGL
jgi:mono/diheme cytochrome c family protein